MTLKNSICTCCLNNVIIIIHDKWVPVMEWRVLRLWMEERPPVWRVAANILNNQSRTADKGWFSNLGFCEGLKIPNRITRLVTKRLNCLGPGLYLRTGTCGGLL